MTQYWGGGGTLVTQYWGGRGHISDSILGGHKTLFLTINSLKFKNIGGRVPPPCSAVPVKSIK